MYCSPNQTKEDFEVFYERLQETIDRIKDKKPHCTILTGDLNCRSKQFCPDYIDSPTGIALDELIESNNLTQLIDQPTNFESRGISCVDLIITDQTNLLVDYGIHSSLDNKCHHQIIHGKSVPARRAERTSNLTFSKCLHLVDLNNPRILMTHDEMAVTASMRA